MGSFSSKEEYVKNNDLKVDLCQIIVENGCEKIGGTKDGGRGKIGEEVVQREKLIRMNC